MEYVNSSSFGEYVHGSSSYGKGGQTDDHDDFQTDSDIIRCLEELEDFQPDSDIILYLGKLEKLTVPVKEFSKFNRVDPEFLPEAYHRYEIMTCAAIQVYNKQRHTSWIVGDVKGATSLPTCPSRMRLTFTAKDGSYRKPFQTFEAEVEGCVKYGLEVISCNPIL